MNFTDSIIFSELSIMYIYIPLSVANRNCDIEALCLV